LSIKTKLFAGVGSLTLAAGALAFAAPAANAAVTTVGTCQNLLALGSAKSTTINPVTGKGYGITDRDNLDGALSAKGVDPTTNKGANLGSCSFPNTGNVSGGNGVPDNSKPVGIFAAGSHTVTKWSTKLFSREFDCNTTDTGDTTEWSPSGALSLTFADLNTASKPEAITAQVTVDGFTDPDSNPATPSDVVAFHGIVTKGAALGADVAGETEFDPTIADKTQTSMPGPYTGTVNPPYAGYNYDLANGLACQDATPNNANIVTYMNGSVGDHSQLLLTPLSGITFTLGSA
jgi:hypothetical protein